MAKGIGGFFFGNTPKVPDYQRVDPGQEQLGAVANNQAILPRAQQLASNVNQFNMEQVMKALEFAMPGGVASVRENIANQLAGNADMADLQAGIRGATAAGYNLGVPGSQFNRFGVAGQLGRSVAQQRQQGLQNFLALSQVTKAPQFDVSSMFLTPQQRIQTAMQNTENQFARDWLKAQVDAAPNPVGAWTMELIMEAVKSFAGAAGKTVGG